MLHKKEQDKVEILAHFVKQQGNFSPELNCK